MDEILLKLNHLFKDVSGLCDIGSVVDMFKDYFDTDTNKTATTHVPFKIGSQECKHSYE